MGDDEQKSADHSTEQPPDVDEHVNAGNPLPPEGTVTEGDGEAPMSPEMMPH